MSDMCRVFMVGNFGADIVRRRRDDGTCYGVTTLCVGRTDLLNGQPITTTVSVPIAIVGVSRVASIGQQFGAGSRVLVEGHLESHTLLDTAQPELVVVIDTILNAATAVSDPEAQRQPTRIAWQEQSNKNS